MFLGVTLLVIGLRGWGNRSNRSNGSTPSDPLQPELAAYGDDGQAPAAAPRQPPQPPQPPPPRFERYPRECAPVRDEPNSFRSGSAKPAGGEGKNSISIDQVSFHPERDLVEIFDDRIWWESDNDNDTNDDENDHLFHFAMVQPMCRLVEMVEERGGVLKVQDTYRESGVHAPRSLHKQGRAVDVTWKDPKTGENRSLSTLARMCWAAGFDWVFFENSPPHIHASVRPDAD